MLLLTLFITHLQKHSSFMVLVELGKLLFIVLLRGESKIVLCCASSGIAALLLPGGRTAHSLFKIPIDGLSDESLCGVPKESLRADLLCSTELIIWDESLMHHRRTHECLDRTLRDIRDDEHPFGGLTIVFGGDFQQILPVIPKGTEEEIVDACLQCSFLCNNIEVLTLSKNERLECGSDEEDFAKWLLDIGHGSIITTSDCSIPFPDEMRAHDPNALINFIYPHLGQRVPAPQYFSERIILAPRNHDVDDMNEDIRVSRMPGESSISFSADSIVSEEGIFAFSWWFRFASR